MLRHGDASLLLCRPSLAGHRYRDELLARDGSIADAAPGRIRCAALPQSRGVSRCPARRRGSARVESVGALPRAGRGRLRGAPRRRGRGEVAPSRRRADHLHLGDDRAAEGHLHAQRTPVLQSPRFAEVMGLAPEDRVFTSQPFFWTAGIAMSLGASLAAGACLVLQETFERRPRPRGDRARAHQRGARLAPPGAGPRRASRRRAARPPSVRKTRFSSPLARLAGLEKDVWGMDASYGLSEAFTIAAGAAADTPAEQRARSSGRALPARSCASSIRGPARRSPAGEPGEIAVQGATLMRGYYKLEPELAFDADGWFRTQDGGSLDADGHLHWTGRPPTSSRPAEPTSRPSRSRPRCAATRASAPRSRSECRTRPSARRVLCACGRRRPRRSPARRCASSCASACARQGPAPGLLFSAGGAALHRNRRSRSARCATPRSHVSPPSAPRSPVTATDREGQAAAGLAASRSA